MGTLADRALDLSAQMALPLQIIRSVSSTPSKILSSNAMRYAVIISVQPTGTMLIGVNSQISSTSGISLTTSYPSVFLTTHDYPGAPQSEWWGASSGAALNCTTIEFLALPIGAADLVGGASGLTGNGFSTQPINTSPPTATPEQLRRRAEDYARLQLGRKPTDRILRLIQRALGG